MKALSPMLVFMAVYLVGSLLAGDFYKVPLTVAFLVASAYAVCVTPKLGLKERVAIFSRGAGDENIMLMVWIFVLAGAFAKTADAMGAIDATVNLTLRLLPDSMLLPGLFIAACFISLSIGTSVGTVVALTPVAVGIAEQTGASLPFIVALVVGGGDRRNARARRCKRMIRNDKRSNPRKTFRAVAICAILLFAIYLIINTTAVNTFIASLLALFRPIIWGLVLAYLINPFFRFFERRLLSRINPMGLRRTFSLILTYLTLFLLIGMLVALILPQLAASLMGLIQNFDIYISSAAAQYNKILRSVVESLERMGMTQTRLEPITPAEIKQWLSYLLNIDILMETAQKLLSTDGASSVLNTLGGLVSALTDGIFAIFISLYLLVSKEKRHSQIMTFRRAMFSDKVNREITRACSVANNAFGKFIEGKLLEALTSVY